MKKPGFLGCGELKRHCAHTLCFRPNEKMGLKYFVKLISGTAASLTVKNPNSHIDSSSTSFNTAINADDFCDLISTADASLSLCMARFIVSFKIKGSNGL